MMLIVCSYTSDPGASSAVVKRFNSNKVMYFSYGITNYTLEHYNSQL